jgi:valyl-tRNA synthetase
MLGKTTLFIPGFDHAGISTQSVVEKRLYKTSSKTRHDLGREKFLETVMDWKNEYAALILRDVARCHLIDWTGTKNASQINFIDSGVATTGLGLPSP